MEDDFGTDEVAVKPFIVAGASANGLWADVDGAPKGFAGAVVCDEGAKGLKGAGAGDPNGEDVSPVFAAKGFIAIEDGAVVDWFGFGSLRLSANRTCLLLWNPRPLPPLPLTIVLFCPLCARFVAFSSRS